MNPTFMNTKLNDSRLNSSTTSSVRGTKKSIDDFEFLINEKSKFKTSELGQGSYGTVKKAKEKATGKIVAIKIVK